MTIKLQERNGQYSITLPKNIVEIEGFEKGQKFEVIKLQGYLALKPVH
ncbi:hypothetical protein Mpsy_3150 [Methanolobus psychrophilus R15]|nr:hypothetical protein Mpsy_3150 [Methanolobus psychrophilus R15]